MNKKFMSIVLVTLALASSSFSACPQAKTTDGELCRENFSKMAAMMKKMVVGLGYMVEGMASLSAGNSYLPADSRAESLTIARSIATMLTTFKSQNHEDVTPERDRRASYDKLGESISRTAEYEEYRSGMQRKITKNLQASDREKEVLSYEKEALGILEAEFYRSDYSARRQLICTAEEASSPEERESALCRLHILDTMWEKIRPRGPYDLEKYISISGRVCDFTIK